MDMLKSLDSTKKWIRALTEIAVLLVALSIVAAILFGEAVPFLGGTADADNWCAPFLWSF